MKKTLLLAVLLCCSYAQAAVIWQDYRVSYLSGDHYRLGDNNRDIYTFEHAAATSWGDSFFFLDHIRPDQGDLSNYAEWAPRWSFSKLGLADTKWGLISDVGVATTVEMSNSATHLLYGLGLNLDVPLFRYLQVNLYRRHNDGRSDNWQTTITWGLPFALGEQEFLYDGFIDWASGKDHYRANLNMTSQFKWLLSKPLNIKDKIYLGFEYVLWLNKFGVRDQPAVRSDEYNLNLLLKWHF
ncbi:outer membrane protein OmpK [Rheinheimera sp.]|uniref:outer membrane protein OmpK n=1 Tax=Rheinheimera sp. TaxID=1869214 RepID=UPI00307DEA17